MTIFDHLFAQVTDVSQLEAVIEKRHLEFSGWNSKCSIKDNVLRIEHSKGQELVYNLETDQEVYGRFVNCGLTKLDLDILKRYLDRLKSLNPIGDTQ